MKVIKLTKEEKHLLMESKIFEEDQQQFIIKKYREKIKKTNNIIIKYLCTSIQKILNELEKELNIEENFFRYKIIQKYKNKDNYCHGVLIGIPFFWKHEYYECDYFNVSLTKEIFSVEKLKENIKNKFFEYFTLKQINI